MKKICFLIIAACLSVATMAQTAKSVLDKTAATLSHKGGITADYRISSEAMGSTTGKIAVKGQKFFAEMPQIMIWFDGKTQWAYMKDSEEVNVNTPSESDHQMINPYSFLALYKKGFDCTMKTSGNNYEVHMTATDKKRSVQEMFITIGKTSYVPSKIRMRQGKNWTTINISNFKKGNLSDNMFRFNAKKYPNAEVIDLR